MKLLKFPKLPEPFSEENGSKWAWIYGSILLFFGVPVAFGIIRFWLWCAELMGFVF